jgi:hypothetical protein
MATGSGCDLHRQQSGEGRATAILPRRSVVNAVTCSLRGSDPLRFMVQSQCSLMGSESMILSCNGSASYAAVTFLNSAAPMPSTAPATAGRTRIPRGTAIGLGPNGGKSTPLFRKSGYARIAAQSSCAGARTRFTAQDIALAKPGRWLTPRTSERSPTKRNLTGWPPGKHASWSPVR